MWIARSGVLMVVASMARTTRVQSQQFQAPTPAECTAFVAALNGGSRDDGDYPGIAGCGAAAANALAAALNSARTDNTGFLITLRIGASQIRDNGLLTVARSIAGDPNATANARLSALLIGMAQLGLEGMRMGKTFADVLGNPNIDNCYWSYGAGEEPFFRSLGAPLVQPAERLAGTMDSIYHSTAPQAIRSFARCLRLAIPYVEYPTVPASAIAVSYVCGNLYSFKNNGVELAWILYRVSNGNGAFTTDQGSFQLLPGEERWTSTRFVGTVYTYFFLPKTNSHLGALITQTPHLGTVCP